MLCLVSRISDVMEKAGVFEKLPAIVIEMVKGLGLVENLQSEARDLIGMARIRVVLPCESKDGFSSGRCSSLFRHSHFNPVCLKGLHGERKTARATAQESRRLEPVSENKEGVFAIAEAGFQFEPPVVGDVSSGANKVVPRLLLL